LFIKIPTLREGWSDGFDSGENGFLPSRFHLLSHGIAGKIKEVWLHVLSLQLSMFRKGPC
jgi:hypothetical protein